MRNGHERSGIGLGIAAAAAVLLTSSPRPNLVWFAMPTLRMDNESFRVTLLVPAGWKLITPNPHGNNGFIVGPVAGIQRDDDEGSLVEVFAVGRAGYVDYLAPEGCQLEMQEHDFGLHSVWIAYARRDQREFDATFAAILNSVKVIRIRNRNPE